MRWEDQPLLALHGVEKDQTKFSASKPDYYLLYHFDQKSVRKIVIFFSEPVYPLINLEIISKESTKNK